jgi:hypothetical protein
MTGMFYEIKFLPIKESAEFLSMKNLPLAVP